ncbi:hypothetical protein Pyn_01916 [Prunus yedoensis var. nudiflora]|uniref:HTH myb-type domain-containing protein n=1 Tax=Prunus yedoensis var. nudiflora TaxID=2094558 RepID=A0A314Y0H5_PRUYE|nr:hypothetical protein Pyn_01916 [Prunus yedoensis var. nudiflora]
MELYPKTSWFAEVWKELQIKVDKLFETRSQERGSFSEQEERTIIEVHRILGNKWAQIAKAFAW